MNFLKTIFSRRDQGASNTNQAAPPTKTKKPVQDQKAAKEQLAASVAETLSGLPNKALLAVGARVSARLLPVVERIAQGSFELHNFKNALSKAEFVSGLSCEPVATPKQHALNSNLRVWYAATLMLVFLNLLQAAEAPESGGNLEPSILRDKITKYVVESITSAFTFSCAIYKDEDKLLVAIMAAFRRDCEHLRSLISEKALNDATPISAEWLGDIWWSEQNAYKQLIKAA